MSIPEGAIEAAAKAFYGSAWDDYSHADLKYALDQIRETLEAAVPHMSRTITTAEELDALPVGSIVRTQSYSIYVKDSIRGDEQRSWWVTVNEQFDFETKDIELPTTVLYEQERPK